MKNRVPDAAAPGDTRASALRRLTGQLAEAGIESPGFEARTLLCAASGCDHAGLIRDPGRLLGADEAARLEDFAARRLDGEPSTRIIGARAFWTLDLQVTPDVLDPRPDSECLIEAALQQLADRRHAPLRILDLGVGSGALLLALLSECPNATGVGVDASPAACEIARANARANDLDARTEIRLGNWAEGLVERFDVILSNPPYIPSGDIAGLDRAVRNFDPALALDGGDDGLESYRQIIAVLPGLLADGVAVLELGVDQALDVGALAAARGLEVLELRKDLGGVDRAMVIRRGLHTTA